MSKRKTTGRLAGKSAIITGATGGIGGAAARLFLDEGANVTVVGRSADKVSALVKKLDAGDRVAHVVGDAADEDAAERAATETLGAFGRIDVLFANAGTEGAFKPLEKLTEEEFGGVLRTNVIGPWLSLKHCVAAMKKQKAGSVIVTASIAGVVGFPTASAYSASKHAVYGLVKTAALELGGANIRVNAIAPGPIDNRMMRSVEAQLSPDDPQAAYGDVKNNVAMQRYGTNEEVARLAAFLASDDASYCNGGIYLVDGGYVAA